MDKISTPSISTPSRSVHKLANKELGKYPTILTSRLVNNPYFVEKDISALRIFLLNLVNKAGKNINYHLLHMKILLEHISALSISLQAVLVGMNQRIPNKFSNIISVLDQSSSRFYSGAPSPFVSRNKTERRQRPNEQQVLAGSNREWNGSFGLLWHELRRLLTISFIVM